MDEPLSNSEIALYFSRRTEYLQRALAMGWINEDQLASQYKSLIEEHAYWVEHDTLPQKPIPSQSETEYFKSKKIDRMNEIKKSIQANKTIAKRIGKISNISFQHIEKMHLRNPELAIKRFESKLRNFDFSTVDVDIVNHFKDWAKKEYQSNRDFKIPTLVLGIADDWQVRPNAWHNAWMEWDMEPYGFTHGLRRFQKSKCSVCSKSTNGDFLDLKLDEDYSLTCKCGNFVLLPNYLLFEIIYVGVIERIIPVWRQEISGTANLTKSYLPYWDHPHCSICGKCGTNKTSHNIGHPDATRSGYKSHCRNRRI